MQKARQIVEFPNGPKILRRRITTLQIIELLSGPRFTETRALSTNNQSSFVKVEELDHIIEKIIPEYI